MALTLSRFYQGKNILITGADGFMGSFLTERLLKLGAIVSVFVKSNFSTGVSSYALKNIPRRTHKGLKQIIAGDLSSVDSLELIRQADPQIIFHLAANAFVPYSFEHPYEVIKTNIDSTLHIFEASKRLKLLKRIVCTSSSEVYGTALTEKINESHPLNPSSPYAASKAAVDRIAYSYWNTYHLPITIIRPFNTYGPRHTYDVIPKFIRLAIQNQPLTIYGSGDQSRDFTYVDDMVEAFLLMGKTPKLEGKTINFGTGKDVSINTIASQIVEISNSASRIIHVGKRTSEVDKLCCDPTLAKNLCGWEARTSLHVGLRKNIRWAKKHWK